MTEPPPAAVVILAAGLGTRMRSRRPKVLHSVCGRPMLAYVIDAAVEAGVLKVGQRHAQEEWREEARDGLSRRDRGRGA